jgi:hypothetical protein
MMISCKRLGAFNRELDLRGGNGNLVRPPRFFVEAEHTGHEVRFPLFSLSKRSLTKAMNLHPQRALTTDRQVCFKGLRFDQRQPIEAVFDYVFSDMYVRQW